MRASQSEFMRTFERLDLSLTQCKLLMELQVHEGESVSNLGSSIGLSPAAASRAIDQLVRRSLIARVESPDDRRARVLRLTDAGADILRQVTEARMHGLEAFVQTLPDAERDALSAALSPIVARIA
jgi:DNA-binding MarR family transcriptional regulator